MNIKYTAYTPNLQIIKYTDLGWSPLNVVNVKMAVEYFYSPYSILGSNHTKKNYKQYSISCLLHLDKTPD